MDEYNALSHTTWECKDHVVLIAKCRRKTLYMELRRHLGEVFHKLAQQKESKIEEGHLMPDHVHMLISIPPKYAVSQVVGFIKGKGAIHLGRSIPGSWISKPTGARSRNSGATSAIVEAVTAAGASP